MAAWLSTLGALGLLAATKQAERQNLCLTQDTLCPIFVLSQCSAFRGTKAETLLGCFCLAFVGRPGTVRRTAWGIICHRVIERGKSGVVVIFND